MTLVDAFGTVLSADAFGTMISFESASVSMGETS